MKQLARLVAHTGIGPDVLVAFPEVTEELVDLAIEDERRAAERLEALRRQGFLDHTEQRFAAAVSRARRR